MRRATVDAEFTTFAASAASYLSRTAWLLTGDRYRAEDAVQETLARMYVAWPRARRGNPLPYARRVLVNHLTDRYRRSGRERIVADVPERPVTADTHRSLDRDQIVRLLDRLSTRERTILVLRYYADVPEAQVADELGISVGTVKSTASRALARLREVAGADEPSSDPGAGPARPRPPRPPGPPPVPPAPPRPPAEPPVPALAAPGRGVR